MILRCHTPLWRHRCRYVACTHVCQAVAKHPGPHGCEHECAEAKMVAAMYDFLATGRYRPYVLVGENDD